MLILIGGGTCSGKRTLADYLVAELGEANSLRLCLDSFYFPVRRQIGVEINFDHPDALDWVYLHDCICKLIEGNACDVPLYNYITGLRDGYESLRSRSLIILHGLWALWNERLRDLAEVALFVEAPADIRLVRRIRRDILRNQRGWNLEGALDYYLRYTRPMHETFVKPSINYATAVLDGSRHVNDIAQQALCLIHNIQEHL